MGYTAMPVYYPFLHKPKQIVHHKLQTDVEINAMKKNIIIATSYTYEVLPVSVSMEQRDAYHLLPIMQSELAQTPGFAGLSH